jgi:alpha-tubulin suppressor-like RCC1 family protein
MTGQTVTWSSSDAAVATVDSAGLVTAVADGSLTITATSGSFNKAAEVTVLIASSMTLESAVDTLVGTGDTVTVIATVKNSSGTVLPDPNVSWSFTTTICLSGPCNGTIATVSDSGKVTVGDFNETLTLTASYEGINQNKTIVVFDPDSIALNPSAATMRGVGDTLTVVATAMKLPGAPLSGVPVSWSSSNTAVATVSQQGKITSVGGGNVDITVTAGQASNALPIMVQEWEAISTGFKFTCGILKGTDRAYCWGDNSYGQLGDGTTSSRGQPTIVSGDLSWKKISAGARHTVGLTTDGKVYAWGSNSFGQLGDNSNNTRLVPTAIDGNPTMTHIAAGSFSSVAVKNDGSGYAWGNNEKGQLGDGTTTSRSIPTLIDGSLSWSAIEVGSYHMVGLTTNGNAYAWGHNDEGQLGDGTTTNRSIPVLVSGGISWISVSAGSKHSLAVKNDGSGYAWGYNHYGQLGDGTTTSRSIPVLVSGGHTWSSFSGGWDHSVGVSTSGSGYAWGSNVVNQLGDGTTTSRSIPVLVSGGHIWSILEAGFDATLGLTSGDAFGWGYNGVKQLGDGTTTNRSSPVRVGVVSN